MNLVSMKVDMSDCQPCDPSAYPYGTRLVLTHEQCEALGIKGTIKTGTVVKIVAIASVVRCVESAEVGDSESEIALDLQITDMALEGPATEIDAKALYPNSKMED